MAPARDSPLAQLQGVERSQGKGSATPMPPGSGRVGSGCPPGGGAGEAQGRWASGVGREALAGWDLCSCLCDSEGETNLQAASLSRSKSFPQIDGDTFLNSDIKEGKILPAPLGAALISHGLI